MPSSSIGILRGDHQEGLGQRKRLPLDRHLRFLHGLQQRRLRLGGGAVDLVGEQQIGEDGPRPELEPAAALIEEKAAGDVARQQVGRELDTPEAEVERLGQEPGDEGLGESG